MKELNTFLNELENRSGIEFEISTEDGSLIYKSNSYVESHSNVYYPLNLGYDRFVLRLDKSFKACVKLLMYSIENKYNEICSRRYKNIQKLLEEEDLEQNKILNNMFVGSPVLFIVRLNSNVYDGLNIVNQMYTSSDIITMVYKSDIIIIGDFEDVYDHAVSMREAIISNLFCKCVVSFSEISKDNFNLKQAYDNAIEALVLFRRFSLKEEVIDYNKLFLERMAYYMDNNLKKKIMYKFKDKFDELDSEMLNTIDEFVKNGLNISNTAKRLFIHRNTLIYRIDKLKKETGFDIKNFKEAAVFVISFLIWKENK
ncbi:DNA-binding PucR family transcriptional regulator [Clostridium acetobutylicum]|uniref:Possible transcriptional regulator from YAEG/LRPR family n=1 Tax=Clostridium acetobutylicum (strain ATCC 824 / DSM 792 / JCM 1419 / IAM 19013 / LMG 5710 / NBRC 13948 / NRRL B-527 / VKM B-1787 / 2291 / W) TaxID=272562 RepID=Q97E79_CLOAB|nr:MULTISPECIES: PucR family transcriptional regulator [Clostridium]AAK81171.1 Possible transcriptional regulator from YAEG/LRPR family [Clostridium acetobutylicum ATCC 824]ADZ22276.1 putative transcriptional regulator from YAEG/LRPR family [Clostridium acetobutylicum EA 2018]AEI32723.1 transcriptional regulator [Clostridium acetobutylicum DSM 1731]AWV81160.1 PucR family transcriptional regulator [Clostridium acetobutylicum]MBC2395638.1 PucR family transcriptional regulator [Clostridium acetob